MFGDMMGKLQEMKQNVEETKKRLETITVSADAGDGTVSVTCNGNRVITNIQINPELVESNEELEDLLVVAMNRALEKAKNVEETEMQGAAKGMLPPGFGM